MNETSEAPREERFRTLPLGVALESTIEVTDTSPVPDPEAGRNTDHDFLLRYLA